MKINQILLGLSLTSWLAFTSPCQAQLYSIDWFTIAGGGDSSAGGVYAISGTIGQADTADLNGGVFGINGGFWSIETETPVPGLPTLTITRSGVNVIVSWNSEARGFAVETTANLSPSTTWSPVSNVVANSASLAISPGPQFFRLRFNGLP